MWENKDQRIANFVKSAHLEKTPNNCIHQAAHLSVWEYAENNWAKFWLLFP